MLFSIACLRACRVWRETFPMRKAFPTQTLLTTTGGFRFLLSVRLSVRLSVLFFGFISSGVAWFAFSGLQISLPAFILLPLFFFISEDCNFSSAAAATNIFSIYLLHAETPSPGIVRANSQRLAILRKNAEWSIANTKSEHNVRAEKERNESLQQCLFWLFHKYLFLKFYKYFFLMTFWKIGSDCSPKSVQPNRHSNLIAF